MVPFDITAVWGTDSASLEIDLFGGGRGRDPSIVGAQPDLRVYPWPSVPPRAVTRSLGIGALLPENAAACAATRAPLAPLEIGLRGGEPREGAGGAGAASGCPAEPRIAGCPAVLAALVFAALGLSASAELERFLLLLLDARLGLGETLGIFVLFFSSLVHGPFGSSASISRHGL